MPTDPVAVWRDGLVMAIARGLLRKLWVLMLIAWPALGLAGFGAIVQEIGLPVLSPTKWCPLDSTNGYVTQEAVAGIPPQELAALSLKPISTPSGGVVFVMEDQGCVMRRARPASRDPLARAAPTAFRPSTHASAWMTQG